TLAQKARRIDPLIAAKRAQILLRVENAAESSHQVGRVLHRHPALFAAQLKDPVQLGVRSFDLFQVDLAVDLARGEDQGFIAKFIFESSSPSLDVAKPL